MKENNKEVLLTVEKILNDNKIKYEINNEAKKKFINNSISITGKRSLAISHDKFDDGDKVCSIINRKIIPSGYHVTKDKYNTLFLSSLDESTLYESDLELPNQEEDLDDLITLLNNTNPKKIYLTSDWHLFQVHYKHEKNPINTQRIISWCKENIKDDDIFMYLGDICFRYTNKEDQQKSAEIFNSLPGIKVLIAGNHDLMLGDDFINKCGFDFIFTEYKWNNLIFTHRPIRMEEKATEMWNIHGHIHKWTGYNTTNGKKNINVYPYFYNNKPVTLEYILNHKEELIKDNYWNNNSMLSEAKRSNLDDFEFGIPEDRKYPLDSKKHINSAIKLFGHAEESKKKKLAKNIADAAKKYDLSIPENTQCYKYLKEGGIQDIIPSDVDTIVFDFGGVLVDSDLEGALHNGLTLKHVIVHEIIDLLEEKIFYNKELFYENKSLAQIKKYFNKIAPDYITPYTNKIFELLVVALHKMEYTDELIKTMRSKGYSIYYLSNWEDWAYKIEKPFLDTLTNKFDGGMFSFESSFSKPDEEFYQIFFNKYNLDPDRCFFFDDKSDNILGAEQLGMRGMIFNKEETPKLLLDDNFNIPSSANNIDLINNKVKIDEWSMAACNPIVGITKPYVLKVSADCGSTINAKQLMLSPDLISDKYLAISENAKLEIVDANKFNDYYVEIYEFVGNKSRLNKLNEMYKSGKTVDNTVIYTALTGKPMLCEDQIDFDPNFKKVDIDLIQESIISEMATLRDGFFKANRIINSISVNENMINKPDYICEYSDIILKEDLDGYYFYNNLNNKRSGSEKNINQLTESMIKSIL